jgi:hypothetical protein
VELEALPPARSRSADFTARLTTGKLFDLIAAQEKFVNCSFVLLKRSSGTNK